MADQNSKSGAYPAIPAKNWWALHKKFKASLPAKVTSDYLASVLAVSDSSAKKILGYLKTLGIVGEDESVTDLGKDWRLEDHYSIACAQMVANVYPQELLDISSGPDVDKEKVKRWFLRKANVGTAQSDQYANMYALISAADISKAAQNQKPAGSSGEKPKGPNSKSSANTAAKTSERAETPVPKGPPVDGILAHPQAGLNPTVHLDIQIHISPEASNEQIEKIFESMGKHIFARGGS